METTIHMTTGKPYAHVKILNDDTSVQEKDVPLQALAAVSQEKEDELYMLPHSLFAEYQPDTHIEGLLLGRTNNTWTTGLFFVPAQKFYMNVAGEKSMMPYPSLLFLLTESFAVPNASPSKKNRWINYGQNLSSMLFHSAMSWLRMDISAGEKMQ